MRDQYRIGAASFAVTVRVSPFIPLSPPLLSKSQKSVVDASFLSHFPASQFALQFRGAELKRFPYRKRKRCGADVGLMFLFTLPCPIAFLLFLYRRRYMHTFGVVGDSNGALRELFEEHVCFYCRWSLKFVHVLQFMLHYRLIVESILSIMSVSYPFSYREEAKRRWICSVMSLPLLSHILSCLLLWCLPPLGVF